ncbi:AlbA family DNA-binding domain-containing protein [Bacillus subtilis]|uniref:AlbA family DNA-binding domain-containing protein n=1 Tax=Bacillus subtilis TaxID=1423 RepID=UPI003D301D8D
MNYNLTRLVKDLIRLKREGDFWDFKEKWHSFNELLIHDILCFSNTVHDRDCFIIVGVNDDGEVVGLGEHERKKQADLINMVNSFPFSGDIPNIKLEHIEIEGKALDILIILNSYSVPFILSKRGKSYKKLKQGIVYSRFGDTNTPIDQGTSFSTIESLWKKRFGLNKTVVDRVSFLLNNSNDWVENEVGFYHLYNPEYSLEYGDYESGDPAFYSYCMDNEHTSYQKIKLKFNGTILEEYNTAILDAGRYRVVIPKWGFIVFDINKKFNFRYYIHNEIDYKLNDLLLTEDNEEGIIARRNFFEVILVFNSEAEKEDFVDYVQVNQEQFLSKFKDKEDAYYSTDNEVKKGQIITGKVLREMLYGFREGKK